MSAQVKKTVVIGLELGDGPLIHHWAQAGLLPQIRSMIDAGGWSWLETTADKLHISAWPSIYTGTSPGDHGVYFTFQPAPGVQGYRRFHQGLYGQPTFWQLLDQAGRRCRVLDPPYSHPENGFGGTFIYDWGSWAHYLQPGSVPANAVREMEKHCGAYPLGMEANDLGLGPLDSASTAQRLLAAVDAKVKATCWLMGERDWDVVFSVFGETHVAGHYCWRDDLQSESGRQQTSDMLQVYQAIDRGIAQIVKAAGDDAAVIIISGDGVGPNHAGWHLLPDVLSRLGHLASAADPRPQGEPPPQRSFDPVKALRDLLPKDFRKNLARMLPTALRDKLAQRVDTADIDWQRTRAYWLPTDLEGYIRVNLRGREPMGIVEPGAQYEAVLNDIEQGLRELRAPDTNEPIVRDVIRTDTAFPGERRPWLPDLIVSWHSQRPISGACSPRIGRVDKASPDPRTGTHRAPGFVLAGGAGIAPTRDGSAKHILDFAPTVLARMGVPQPSQMKGRVWNEFVSH
jgi:predicted AlkP superfamily phosphohydrolase/phosphomutase